MASCAGHKAGGPKAMPPPSERSSTCLWHQCICLPRNQRARLAAPSPPSLHGLPPWPPACPTCQIHQQGRSCRLEQAHGCSRGRARWWRQGISHTAGVGTQALLVTLGSALGAAAARPLAPHSNNRCAGSVRKRALWDCGHQ